MIPDIIWRVHLRLAKQRSDKTPYQVTATPSSGSHTLISRKKIKSSFS